MTDDVTITAPSEVAVDQDELPIIDPQTGWNRLMVRQVARSIQAAHQIHPGCWCIHSWENEPMFAVEMVNVVTVGPTIPYGLIVSTDELDEPQLSLVATYRHPTRVFSGRPWATYLHIPRDQVGPVLLSLESAHLRAVKRLAEGVRSKAMRWTWHRDDFREQIQRIAGIAVPEPQYMPELRVLPNRAANEDVSEEELVGRRYWKISPGTSAMYWKQFRDKSVIAVHWLDDPKDLQLLPDQRSEFVAAVNTYPDATSQAANALWDFSHVIKPGDGVLAYGNRSVLGFGRVTGEY